MNLISIKQVEKESIKKFDCGFDELNDYLRCYARQNDTNNISKSFVLTEEERIIGYYTLSSASIYFEELVESYKKKLPKYPVPCIRIARLAIDKKYQGKHYGATLLKSALIKCYEVSKTIGVKFVIVDAKITSNEFYKKYGFFKVGDGIKRLTYAITMEDIKIRIEK